MITAGTTFSKDVPPYVLAGGMPVRYQGVNNTMLTHYGIDEKIQKHIANAYRLVFLGQQSVYDSMLQIRDQVPDSPEIQNIISFLESTKAGIIGKM
jgi:UDP-N-acetylglucosamine acyltransferase